MNRQIAEELASNFQAYGRNGRGDRFPADRFRRTVNSGAMELGELDAGANGVIVRASHGDGIVNWQSIVARQIAVPTFQPVIDHHGTYI